MNRLPAFHLQKSFVGNPSALPTYQAPKNPVLGVSGNPSSITHFLNDRHAETEKVSDSFTFTTSSDFGAVLVTEAAVKLNYFSEDTPFRRWLNVNFQGLLKSFPHVFERGEPIWIITKTYSSSKCSVACWSGSQQRVSLEFGVKLAVEAGGVSEGVSAAPQASNVRVKTSGAGWAHYGVIEVAGCPLVRLV